MTLRVPDPGRRERGRGTGLPPEPTPQPLVGGRVVELTGDVVEARRKSPPRLLVEAGAVVGPEGLEGVAHLGGAHRGMATYVQHRRTDERAHRFVPALDNDVGPSGQRRLRRSRWQKREMSAVRFVNNQRHVA